jgi:Fe-S cluster biogenesis protein NfuA
MAQDAAFQKRIQRIGEIVEQLESSADPSTRAMAKELIEALMAMHGGALERILEIASEAGEPGKTFILKCGHDELVSSLLLLYGLHPEDMQTRVTRALEKSRAYLDSHSARVELLSISEEGAVTLRLHQKSGGCGSSATIVKSSLEASIQDAAPDAISIIVQESEETPSRSGFVSLAQLESGQTMAALIGARVERGSD